MQEKMIYKVGSLLSMRKIGLAQIVCFLVHLDPLRIGIREAPIAPPPPPSWSTDSDITGRFGTLVDPSKSRSP